jgi:SNF2 family DNA or RNA helicase
MKDITFETKLLNHPYLVAPGPEPGQVAISGVGVFPYSLSDVPKLTALRDILVNNEIATSAGANHKALIFSKWKATLDLIISDVLAPLFPCSQYM